ncbi:MAG: hypothetical protein FJX34_03165 [Alphaproteobacteria bacterium]|nr:hypothetical protein [Alphaproteobacteria bacterium]
MNLFRLFFIFTLICSSALAAEEQKPVTDVESLGLDDVREKQEATPETVPTPSNGIIDEINAQLNNVKEMIMKSGVGNKKEDAPKEEPKAEPAQVETKPLQQNVNATKKQNLKKQAAIKKKRQENEQKQQAKLKKFQELRNRYLLDTSDGDESEVAEEKIQPRKKDLSPFIQEELPPLPILNRYRSTENRSIPLVPTIQERVDLLFAAISQNDIASFNEIYKDIENPNASNSIGDTILTYSLLLRRYSIIAAILAKGADPNLPNKLGYTPIDIAIEMLDFKELEMLVSNKADLTYIDASGRTYLMQASRVGFLPVVDLLVTKGAEVNAMDQDGITALAIAYRHKKEVIVQYLLKHGAKPWIEKTFEPKNQSLIKELENRWN